MGDENSSINISGGNFRDTNVGRDITVIRHSPGATASSYRVTAGGLRDELRRHRAEIVEFAGDKGGRAGRALDDLDEELASPEPDVGFVRERWSFVENLLAAGARAAEHISTITGMVTSFAGP